MSSRLRRGNEAPFKREYKTLKRSVRRRLEETMEGGGGGDHLIKSILWTIIVLFDGLPVEIGGSINLFIFAHLSVVHPGYWSGAAESKSAPMTASSSF
ncbi:hypothetical protein HZH68_007844 [Vespula germanica]|uniref:Uncharacterized protein n=1 Tax=Vespula germanica TaxID=30212 RepID=A0A834K4I0_VESGE|nr:hypothetical protein HZH68_007844 [Vespula germanica]